MSDFLSRVAARAVGAAPVAGPRAPSAFEDAGLSGDAGPEVVGGEAFATGAPLPPPTTHGSEGEGVEPVAWPGVGTALSRVDAGEPDGPVPATGVPSETRRPATFIATPERENRAVEVVPAVLPGRDPGPSVAVTADAAGVPAAIVVAARPAAAAVPRAARPREPVPATTTAAAEIEPQPVRVHIGRLEVRANLQQPAPTQRPRRDEERSPGLSLPDYLRGKRVAS